MAHRPAPRPAAPHVTIVASGKGGTGTSTVAALVAAAAARAGADTLLVDAHETPGSLGLLLGLEMFDGVIAGEAVRRVAPHLYLAQPGRSASDVPGAGAQRSASERRVMYRRVASRFHEFQCVIVDAGARIDDVVTTMSAGAGRMLVVTTVDRVSVAAAYALIKTVGERVGHVPAELVVNRAGDARGAAAYAALRGGLERFLRQTIGFSAAVPEDAELQAAVEAGELLERPADYSAALALEPLALHLMAPPLRVAGLAHLP